MFKMLDTIYYSYYTSTTTGHCIFNSLNLLRQGTSRVYLNTQFVPTTSPLKTIY